MKIKLKTKYNYCEATLQFSQYWHNKQTAIRVLALDGEPLLIATVCVDADIPSGHVAIKNWSENEGVMESLQKSEVIGVAVGSIPCGYVDATVHKLLVEDVEVIEL